MAEPSIDELEAFVTEMGCYLASKLEGSHPSQERLIIDRPRAELILNNLGSLSTSGTDVERMSATKIHANSMAISFLTEKNIERKIKVRPKFNLYYRCYPEYSEQINSEQPDLLVVWKRMNIEIAELEYEISDGYEQITELDISADIPHIMNDSDRWVGGGSLPSSALESENGFANALRSLPSGSDDLPRWDIQLLVKRRKYDDLYDEIEVRITNQTEEISRIRCEESVFAVHNIIRCIDFDPVSYELAKEGSRGDLFANIAHLRCSNCQAEVHEGTIRSVDAGRCIQEKLDPCIVFDGKSLDFEKLSDEIESIKLLNELGQWLEARVISGKNFPILKDRFREGVDLIENDADVRTSFLLAQEVFGKASDYPCWYLYQLIFFVCLIPDIVKEGYRQDEVMLLHMDTGSGKSESYFAVLVFTAFYERLMGKTFGIAAWTKFPLRMVSVQQLERISKIFVWANEVKREHEISGQEFTIGYFVGNRPDFPKTTKEVVDSLGHSVAGKIIKKCPLCDNGETVELVYIDKVHKVVHKCKQCEKQWGFYFDDEQIYRFLPTVLISTVDKAASIAFARQFRNLLGSNLTLCPNHESFVTAGDKCTATQGTIKYGDNENCECYARDCLPSNLSGRRTPTIIIQDELHLLSQGFGTIDSHFETFIQEFQMDICGSHAKIVGMTATANRPDKQVKELYGYNKHVFVFPGIYDQVEKGGDLDPFFEKVRKTNGQIVMQRSFLGLKPNFRDNHFACLLTLKHLATFMAEKHNTGTKQEIIELYATTLTYHGRLPDVGASVRLLQPVVNSKLSGVEILGRSLTGDDSLDGIRGTINDVEKHSATAGSVLKLFSVFSTNVVSHGVDINRWNFMLFQGMPTHTSEYIQALSRVGRKYPSLNIMWFYPTRVRDLSFYRNFNVYHDNLDKRVEPVPILRWANLGVKQTLSTLICAGIINYLSHRLNQPAYKLDDARQILLDSKNQVALTDFIKRSYGIDHLEPHLRDIFEEMIDKELADRFRYLHDYTGGSYKNFFPFLFNEHPDLAFHLQHGMRGIQEMIQLKTNENDSAVLESGR